MVHVELFIFTVNGKCTSWKHLSHFLWSLEYWGEDNLSRTWKLLVFFFFYFYQENIFFSGLLSAVIFSYFILVIRLCVLRFETVACGNSSRSFTMSYSSLLFPSLFILFFFHFFFLEFILCFFFFLEFFYFIFLFCF